MSNPVMPEDIGKDVRFSNHGHRGDATHYEVALTYLDRTRNTPEETTRKHPWMITESQFAEHRGRERELEEETRSRYTEQFLGRLRAELHQTKTILVREGGRLVRQRE